MTLRIPFRPATNLTDLGATSRLLLLIANGKAREGGWGGASPPSFVIKRGRDWSVLLPVIVTDKSRSNEKAKENDSGMERDGVAAARE